MDHALARLAPALTQLIELVLVLATFMAVAVRRRAKKPGQATSFRLLPRALSRLAKRKTLAVVAVGLFVVATRAALIPVLGIPAPRWNDEFSYLLAADTFAHGRLSNPTHPLWVHFESFHIIEQPTYMSMYPPGEGLVLALGQVLGNPWIGQLFITAAVCSALCWMLQGWFSAEWALFGAILAALRLGILSYWMNGYWSGSLPALGGALLLGAWPRIERRPRIVYGLVMAIGIVILANTRPYEGLVFTAPFAIAFLLRLSKSRGLMRLIAPITLVLVMAVAAMGYYYWRVTGSPVRMTYEVNRSTYAMAPYFVWSTPRPEPRYHHTVMRDFYRWELSEFLRNRTLPGFLLRGWDKFLSSWAFYCGPLLTVPLLLGFRGFRWPRKKFLLLVTTVFLFGLAVETWTMPHYVAPATGLIYIWLVHGLRYLRMWRWRRNAFGATLVRMIPVLAIAMITVRVGAAATHTQIEPAWPRGNLERRAVLTELRAMPGDHLVIVRYGPHHDVDREWVYNRADIDHAKVVWARDMGEEQNAGVLRYFDTRKVWTINADEQPPRLTSYPSR